MWVVKLGGSLLRSDHLQAWLDALGCYGGGRVVVVPGGGVFADQVRAAQLQWGCDDRTAHHMALLAMEQYGVLMTGLRTDLVAAGSPRALAQALDRAQVPVWLPRDMVLAAPGLPASWALTSDSLAAWLARELGAEGLLLVKCCELDAQGLNCEGLTRSGVVDPLFCEYACGCGLQLRICGAQAHTGLREHLYAQIGCGVPLACARARPGAEAGVHPGL